MEAVGFSTHYPKPGVSDLHMENATDNAQRQAEQGENPTFNIPGVELHDNGRVTIPSRFRDRHGLVEDDILDIRVRADGVTFWTLDIPVDSAGRIRIPKRKRDLYDVHDGNIVDIDVMVTGMALDND